MHSPGLFSNPPSKGRSHCITEAALSSLLTLLARSQHPPLLRCCPLPPPLPTTELEALGPSERATEEAALQELLAPLGLAVKEIRVRMEGGGWGEGGGV